MTMNTTRTLGTIAVSQNPIFEGLKCAYTGQPLVVRVSVSARLGALYFADGPSMGPYSRHTFKGLPELLKALSQRKGIEGAANLDESMKCPYTGAGITIEKNREGAFWARGMFDPFIPFQGTAEEFAAMVRGKPPADDVKIKVKDVEPPPKADALKEKYAEQAAKMTESVEKAVKAPVSVAVPGPNKDPAPKKETSKARPSRAKSKKE